MFRNKVLAAYVIVADALDSKFKQLAADIISLEYAPAEEQKLLDVLKDAYNHASKDKRTKSQAVTAGMNWDAIIRENREKQQRLKLDRHNANKSLLTQLKQNPSPAVEPTKQKISQEVHKMSNIVKFDFQHPKDKVSDSGEKEDPDFENRMSRIKKSLSKISTLMAELKSMSCEEKKTKPRKPRTYGKGKAAPKGKATRKRVG